MRGLSSIEVVGLVDLSGPEEIVADDDPREDAWSACVERGLATYRDDGERRHWDINDLGRLAPRIHEAVQSR